VSNSLPRRAMAWGRPSGRRSGITVLPNALPGILTGTILRISRCDRRDGSPGGGRASTYITVDPNGPLVSSPRCLRRSINGRRAAGRVFATSRRQRSSCCSSAADPECQPILMRNRFSRKRVGCQTNHLPRALYPPGRVEWQIRDESMHCAYLWQFSGHPRRDLQIEAKKITANH